MMVELVYMHAECECECECENGHCGFGCGCDCGCGCGSGYDAASDSEWVPTMAAATVQGRNRLFHRLNLVSQN